MLRYQDSIIKKLPVADENSEPAPFPGKYPTRIKVVYKDRVYIGKPFLNPAKDALSVTEFDKKHIVATLDCVNKIACYTSRAFGCYHPALSQPATGSSYGLITLSSCWFNRPVKLFRLPDIPGAFYESKQYAQTDIEAYYKPILVKLYRVAPKPTPKPVKRDLLGEKAARLKQQTEKQRRFARLYGTYTAHTGGF